MVTEDLVGGVDLSEIVIEDDAEEELTAMLHRSRKLKQHEFKKETLDNDGALKVFHFPDLDVKVRCRRSDTE